jgi:hypothetical protein
LLLGFAHLHHNLELICLQSIAIMDRQAPAGKQVYESDIAQYWFDNNGILISVSKSPRRTVENITSNAKMIKEITNNKPVPLLVYLVKSPVPDKQTRELVNKELPKLYSAMAMVADSALAKLIMNVLFKLKPAPIPMRSFSDYQQAKEWLKHYL